MGLLVDRKSVEDHIYGRTGVATANFLNNPERFRSKTMTWEFNIDKANDLLEKAGWKRGPDGIRAKDGKKLKFVYQTSINTPRQKTQAIVKQACQKAGIDLELKSVTASVFFSSDVANPDTYSKFYCDIQMYTTTMTQPDPETFMNQFISAESRHEGEQVAGPQHHALVERGVRHDVPCLRRRTRSGQACGDVHPHERTCVRQPGGHSGGLSAARRGDRQQAAMRHQRLGHRHGQPQGLVQRGVSLAPAWSSR